MKIIILSLFSAMWFSTAYAGNTTVLDGTEQSRIRAELDNRQKQVIEGQKRLEERQKELDTTEAATRALMAAAIASEEAKTAVRRNRHEIGKEKYDLEGLSVTCFMRDGRPTCSGGN